MSWPTDKHDSEKLEEVQEVEEEKEVEVKSSTAAKKGKGCTVRKLIKSPMRLSMTKVLNDNKPYTLKPEEFKDKKFMEHIEKLIELKKIEKA